MSLGSNQMDLYLAQLHRISTPSCPSIYRAGGKRRRGGFDFNGSVAPRPSGSWVPCQAHRDRAARLGGLVRRRTGRWWPLDAGVRSAAAGIFARAALMRLQVCAGTELCAEKRNETIDDPARSTTGRYWITDPAGGKTCHRYYWY
jgi:hypothetical protein